jgi:hypothetical protein
LVLLDSFQVSGVNVQLQVPTERLDASDDLPTDGFVEAFAAEMPDEVDPRAANPVRVQLLQLRIRGGRSYQGNAPAILAVAADHGQQGPVILPVRAALDEHAAFDPKGAPKLFQGLDRGRRRLEGRLRGEGKPVEGPVDVGMTIASAREGKPSEHSN